MAVTITPLDLAVALRTVADRDTALVEPLLGEMTRYLATVREIVTTYAALAPDSIHNESAIRLAAWLYDVVPGRNFANPLGQSGAGALLAPYRVRRATAV